MIIGRIDEKALNAYIAQAMERLSPPGYMVDPEVHRQARIGTTSADIVVRMPYNLRTIIESEYGEPAVDDAKERLGYEFHGHTRYIKSVIALGIPSRLGDPDLRHADRYKELLSDSQQFLMQVVTGKSPQDPEIEIAPEEPISVSLRDLVQYAWLSAIPEAYTADVLQKVVADLQSARAELSQLLVEQGIGDELGVKYGNPDSENPTESAAGNIVGTLVSMIELHRNLKQWGRLEEVLPIASPNLWNTVSGEGVPSRIAAEWRKIEAVDYQPLSTIAADMLQDPELSPRLGGTLKSVHQTIDSHIEAGLSATTNVAAAVWQELTPDRDERAVNYTRPHRAELLANMTAARLENPAEARYVEICAGTGTLARATEENIRFRHYADSRDKSSIHSQRMEKSIQLTDISQQSVSVATANLTSLEPQTSFKTSAIFAITASGGSLNFLKAEGVSDMQQQLIGSYGQEGSMLVLEPGSAGICCNNDPYFRARGGAKNPISAKEMQSYKQKADKRVKGVANGNAGLATFMHVIEHKMLADGAPHGKVLPLTAAHAKSYEGFRRNIENEYSDVIAISTSAGTGESMSDDTGIQEMLLIGTKRGGGNGDQSVTCVNLVEDFYNKLEAKMYADEIMDEIAKGKPYGTIVIGEAVGTYNRMVDLGEGTPWHSLGSSGDYTRLTNFATHGVAWNIATGEETEFSLPMTTLKELVEIGPTHHRIGSIPNSRDPVGAFWMEEAGRLHSNLNPSMWVVNYEKQTSITCVPTHFGSPRGDVDEAKKMLATASHFHLSRNLRQSAQAIAVAYTEEPCMGGRSWTTIHADTGVAKAISLFLNSTYGLLIRIGYGQSTDIGRSPIQIGAIPGHPIPDFAADTAEAKSARAIAEAEFDRLRSLRFKRISLAAIDPSRAEIDEVVTKMLGLKWSEETAGMLVAWRRSMCRQTIVHDNNNDTLAELKKAGVIE